MIPLPDFLTTGRASCTTADPDLFTTCTPANVQQAKPICGGCPLLLDCQRWAIDNQEPIGVWGGLTPSERVQLRHGAGWWADDDGRIRVPCGTVEALGAHRGYGETCQVCEAAEAATIAAQRRAALEREHSRPRGGSRRGYELHQLLDEEPCVPCTKGARMSAAIRAARSRGKTSRPAPGLALAS
jgi:WhiB family redox-sensing transcriptional regulator